MSENDVTLSGGTDLLNQSELYEPMLYYGSKPRIQIEYVSDIHLLHHVRYYGGDIRRTVRAVAKSLYDSSQCFWGVNAQVFLGDISSDRDVTVAFYKQYRMNVAYHQYKQFKREMVNLDDILAFERRQANARIRRDKLAKFIAMKEAQIKQLKIEINQYVNYVKVITPKGGIEDIKKYLESRYYKKRNLPYSVTKKILIVASLEDEIGKLKWIEQKLDKIILAEIPEKPVMLTEFKYKHSSPIGFVILGNHEYVGFTDVDEAVEFYKKTLEPLGYLVLQNEFVENDKVVFYGGSGFAKYNERFNANNLVCCDAMMGNREYEAVQTTLFEKGYEKAKHYAQKTGKCFICASHYPVDSCLGKFDREAIYFTGHTHKNERRRTEDKVLYADNQVGYHNDGKFDGVICFKCATTDSIRNPYGDFEDGYYLTSPDTYLQFSDYIGEYIGEGKLIRKRCETGDLYVIKSRGYYGFFVVGKSGISIVNGGKTKKISLSKNIEWIFDNFDIVVGKYLAVLVPLRTTQMRISHELQRLGFDGSIHGLIVDIDSCNHVMVNPVDGSITFYYSPEFGQVQEFESFQKQLVFMVRSGFLEGKVTETEHNEIDLYGSYMLPSAEKNGLLSEMKTVSKRIGAYGVSRAVSPLQRLFTGHVLRDFDLRLIEVEDRKARSRVRSFLGRVYADEYGEYFVIHDDLRESVRVLNADGMESVITIQKLKSSITGDSWSKACWITQSVDETIAEYGEELPVAWKNAIQTIYPRLLEGKN